MARNSPAEWGRAGRGTARHSLFFFLLQYFIMNIFNIKKIQKNCAVNTQMRCLHLLR